MSQQEYYEDKSKWGGYAYVSLKEIIYNYIMGRADTDSTANTPRHKLIYQAKRGIRKLYYDVVREIKAQEMELSPTLTITLPHDYVAYVRISWVDEFGKLHPFAEDDKMSVAKVYLQDNDYELLFDDEGNILEGGKVINKDSDTDPAQGYYFCKSAFTPNADRSESFSNGRFKIDKDEGVIRFGSAVEGKFIVLEYVTDGLYDNANIRINKFAEDAVHDFIYYQLIKNMTPKTMALNEKIRARKEWFNSRRLAKRRLNPINKVNLIQAMKGSTKWIK